MGKLLFDCVWLLLFGNICLLLCVLWLVLVFVGDCIALVNSVVYFWVMVRVI